MEAEARAKITAFGEEPFEEVAGTSHNNSINNHFPSRKEAELRHPTESGNISSFFSSHIHKFIIHKTSFHFAAVLSFISSIFFAPFRFILLPSLMLCRVNLRFLFDFLLYALYIQFLSGCRASVHVTYSSDSAIFLRYHLLVTTFGWANHLAFSFLQHLASESLSASLYNCLSISTPSSFMYTTQSLNCLKN
jgi:hypothetical protein